MKSFQVMAKKSMAFRMFSSFLSCFFDLFAFFIFSATFKMFSGVALLGG